MPPITSDSLQIARLEEQFSYMRQTLEQMNARLASMEAQFAESRGGWRTLAWLGGVAATFGGAVAWCVEHVSLK